MSLYQIVMEEHSRAQAVMIADIIIKKPVLLKELMEIVFIQEEPVSRRAAWPLRFIHERDIRLLDSYIPLIIAKLPEIKSVAIQRNLLYLLANTKVPELFYGKLLNFVSRILVNTGSSVASLIYSIDIYFNISKNEPDLLAELRLIIELLIPNATAGVRSKCLKTLSKISRLERQV